MGGLGEFLERLGVVVLEQSGKKRDKIKIAKSLAKKLQQVSEVETVTKKMKERNGIVALMYTLTHGKGHGFVHVSDEGIGHLPVETSRDGKFAKELQRGVKDQLLKIAQKLGAKSINSYSSPEVKATGWIYEW